MKSQLVAMTTLLLTIIVSSNVRGDYFLEFKPRTPFTMGTPTTVDIVLRETRASGATSDLGTKATTFGNFRFTWSGSLAYTVSNLQDHEVQNGRFFDQGPSIVLNTTSNFGTVVQSDSIVSATEDPLGTITSPIEATLRLGSFVLSGGAEGTSVTFTMADFSGDDDIVLDDGTVLDGLINYGTTEFSVAAIPEPSSWIAVGAMVWGVGFRQWRKRRQSRTGNPD